MKILISSIGSRGDVQPLLALAVELMSLGHHPRLCVAPNFKEWAESFGIECLPVGPYLKRLADAPTAQAAVEPSKEELQALAANAVRSQFPVLMEAAHGCDLVLSAGALQLATRSVSEALGIPYVFAGYCPAIIPSPDHPPPKIRTHYSLSLSARENLALWEEDERSWNDLFRRILNEERAKLGLDAVGSVYAHILTDRPWLAADSILAPLPDNHKLQIIQTGAWLLEDQRSLPAYVEEFLASGAPPVYFGFGSMRVAEQAGRVLVDSARALGLRSVFSQGWGNLRPLDDGSDCLLIDDVAHQKLFPRVAAVVHHGGAGTTTTAASAGVPQVIIPHLYDQFYWAHRAEELAIGVAGPGRDALTMNGLTVALKTCLNPAGRASAGLLANRVEKHGARAAADLLGRAVARRSNHRDQP